MLTAEDGAARAMAGNGLGDKGHEMIDRQALHRSGGTQDERQP